MEIFNKSINGYKIRFLYNENLLKINVHYNLPNGNDKIKFKNIIFNLESKFRKYISNFNDLIKQIKENKIDIRINNDSIAPLHNNNIKIKEYYFQFLKKEQNNDIIIISERIYSLNVEYYLIEGATCKTLNSRPFFSYLKTNYFNLEEILKLIDNEKILNTYKIYAIKYYDEEKKVFKIIKNENNIYFGEKLILHFHIKKLNRIFYTNLSWYYNYFHNEINKINHKFEKSSDIIQKYDLIYLYASPIINDNSYSESESPISYMEEIRTILKLMEKKNKKFKCKFECIGEDTLKDILTNYKTKILHISAHGFFDGNKYSLNIENLNQNGQSKLININNLDSILKLCMKNVSKLDLVIASTCYSEDLSDLFLKYGAKNAIYVDRKVEIIDRISVLFVKFFYYFLFEGYSIKKSYEKAICMMKIDKEIISLNSNSCCCNHYHKPGCIFKDEYARLKKHSNIHSLKSKLCKCKNKTQQGHFHNDNCDYYKKLLEDMKEDLKDIKKENEINIICCCDRNINHNEITKISRKPEGQNGNILLFEYIKKGKILINSKIRFNYDKNKFDFILGRKNIIGKIFNNIRNNGNFVVLFGDKDLSKINFSESLCVYLYERKIINNYEIFRIKNEWDFNYIKDKIFQTKNEKSFYLCRNKNAIIIKFEIENDEISFKYFNEIYNIFVNNAIKTLYLIFIFNSKQVINDENIDKQDEFKKYIEKYISKEIKLEKEKNLFYLGINTNKGIYVLNNFLQGKNINIKDDEKIELIKTKAEYKPKKIKLLSELLLQGETPEKIKKMEMIKMINVKLSSNESIYKLYYLLLNLPSGLPDPFLQLIFNDYINIKDNNNLIMKSIDNWNIINKNKITEENFKEKKYLKSCYITFFKTLEIYTKFLKSLIDKKREKIIYKDGEIHYIFNSYSNEKAWKNQIPNTFKDIIS